MARAKTLLTGSFKVPAWTVEIGGKLESRRPLPECRRALLMAMIEFKDYLECEIQTTCIYAGLKQFEIEWSNETKPNWSLRLLFATDNEFDMDDLLTYVFRDNNMQEWQIQPLSCKRCFIRGEDLTNPSNKSIVFVAQPQDSITYLLAEHRELGGVQPYLLHDRNTVVATSSLAYISKQPSRKDDITDHTAFVIPC